MRTKTHSAVRLPRAERRDQIVRAAASAFLTGGYEKTSMEDVARAAGVTRLIVYRIFETKEALYRAVLNEVLDDIAASFNFGSNPEEFHGRRSVASLLLAVARRHPDGFRLLWRHTSNQVEFANVYRLFEAAATDYAVALISGVLRDPSMVRWAAESLVSNIYESICIWLDQGDPARDDRFLKMLTDGITATVTAWEKPAVDAPATLGSAVSPCG